VNRSNHLRLSAALVCGLVFWGLPLKAHNKEGDKLIKEGEKAEAQKDYDIALDDYSRALDIDPREPAYLIAVNRVRAQAAQAHVQKGRELQREQKLNQALVEFQRALLADPSSQIALQEIRQTTAMVKEQQKAPPGTTILTPAEKARREVEARINSLEGPPELRPINNQISSLKMTNQPPRVW
jgi:general secretion pathway protein D